MSCWRHLGFNLRRFERATRDRAVGGLNCLFKSGTGKPIRSSTRDSQVDGVMMTT